MLPIIKQDVPLKNVEKQRSPGENMFRSDDRRTASDSKILSHVNLLDKLKPNGSTRPSSAEPNAIKSLVKSSSAVDLKNNLNKAEEAEPNPNRSSLRKFIALRNAYKKTQKPKQLNAGKSKEIVWENSSSGEKGTPVMMKHKHLKSPESSFSNRSFVSDIHQLSSSDASDAIAANDSQTRCNSLPSEAKLGTTEPQSFPSAPARDFKFSEVSSEWSNDESESYDESEPEENKNSKAVEQGIFEEVHGNYAQLSKPVEEENPFELVAGNNKAEVAGECEWFENLDTAAGILTDSYRDAAMSGSCDTISFEHHNFKESAETNDDEYKDDKGVFAVKQRHKTEVDDLQDYSTSTDCSEAGFLGQHKSKAQLDETEEQGSERQTLIQEPDSENQNDGVVVYRQKNVPCIEEPGLEIQNDEITIEEPYSERQTDVTEIQENDVKKQDDANDNEELVPKKQSDIIDDLELFVFKPDLRKQNVSSPSSLLEPELNRQRDASGIQDRNLIWEETAAFSEETDLYIQETDLCSQKPEFFIQEPEVCVHDQELCIQEDVLNIKTDISEQNSLRQSEAKAVLGQEKVLEDQHHHTFCIEEQNFNKTSEELRHYKEDLNRPRDRENIHKKDSQQEMVQIDDLKMHNGELSSKEQDLNRQWNEQDYDKEVSKQNKKLASQITKLKEQTGESSVHGEISMCDLHKESGNVDAVNEGLNEQSDQTGSYQLSAMKQNLEQSHVGRDFQKQDQESTRQITTQKESPVLGSNFKVSSEEDDQESHFEKGFCKSRNLNFNFQKPVIQDNTSDIVSQLGRPIRSTKEQDSADKLNFQAKDLLKPATKPEMQEEDLLEQIVTAPPKKKQALQRQNYCLNKKEHDKITYNTQMNNKAHNLNTPISAIGTTDCEQQAREKLQIQSEEPSYLPGDQLEQTISSSCNMQGSCNKQGVETSDGKIIKSVGQSCDNPKLGRFCLTKSYKTPEQKLVVSSRVKALRDLYESISSKPQESNLHEKCVSGVQSLSGGIGKDLRLPEFSGNTGNSLVDIHIADEMNSKGTFRRPFVRGSQNGVLAKIEENRPSEKDFSRGTAPSAVKFQVDKNKCLAQRRHRLKRQCAVDDENLDFLDSTVTSDSSKLSDFMFRKQSTKVPEAQRINSGLNNRRQRLKKLDAFAFWKSFELLNQNCADGITNPQQKFSQSKSLGHSVHGSTSASCSNSCNPLVKKTVPQNLEKYDKCCGSSSTCRLTDDLSACSNPGKRSVLEKKSLTIPNENSHSYGQTTAGNRLSSAENIWSKYKFPHELPSDSCPSAKFESLEKSKTKQKSSVPTNNIPDMKRDSASHVCCKGNSGRSAVSLPPGDRARTVDSSKDPLNQRLSNVNETCNRVQDSDVTGCDLKTSKAASSQETPVCSCELCSHGFHDGCTSANSSFFVHHGVFFVAFPFTTVLEIARHKPK